jgi:hypothetical protein
MDLEGRVIPQINLTQNRFAEYALTSTPIGWFVHDNHLYLVNDKMLTQVLLNGLFNDPEEIYNINCPGTDSNCPTYMEEEFPIDSDLVDSMYKLALDLLLLAQKQPLDTENNFKDAETTQAIQ